MAEYKPFAANAALNPKSEQQAKDALPTILVNRNIAEYDPLHALDTLCEFNHFLKAAVSRYEENERLRVESEKKSNDLLHYIELRSDMNASEGYKAYKKLAEVRRERRCCKNENELLAPIYTFVHQNTKLINELTSVLGRCRGVKELIEKRAYCARTDII